MILLTEYTKTWADIDWQLILGGFGLFLFGIKFMGDGLKSLAGDRMRDIIDRFTSKPWMGVLIGLGITALIQSSSATTAITIGFVRAGLMRLDQTVGIIFGANIGTTVTAFLVGLKVEKYALYFVFLGALFILFASRKKYKYTGEILMGFGTLFYGLMLMGNALKVMKDIQSFHDLAVQMSSQPILALLGGIVMTGVIQSSSAMIAIIQKIYESGGMSLTAAIPFVFGSNIGTTVTAALAAIGGSLAARRAAGIHTLFNVLGTVIMMFFLPFYMKFIVYLSDLLQLESMMQIAVAHILFNIIFTIAFFPFINQLVWLIKKILRGDEKERIEINTDDLDPKLAASLPAGALNVAKKATMKMGELAVDAIENSRQYMNTRNKAPHEVVLQLEDAINALDTKLTDYLLIIAKEHLGEHDMEIYSTNLAIIKNLERIGDLSTNLIEFYEMVFDVRENFSEAALEDVNAMYDLVIHMLNRSMRVYSESDYSLHSSVMEDESYLDLLEFKARQKHFDRMTSSVCMTAVGSSVFVDILGTLERIGDHATNIAKNAVDVHQTHEPKASQV
ncbi:MAG: Na/Pi-cotransporter II [Firmicutes bacterium GWF2_51_9]|nr:Na/Pi cotransporter family protein [Erysipelotrichaceae bacterium]OGS53894.1 MAG: Na/Pi-cotransporter II [Firmicutes bacterium GWF2_51_9]OGS59119.1 MAG: Na/Pi-cotransporter II [Firmicutes bacterium GWE2_51_13]HBZ41221.1 Na/Pi-cotransporter II [Erysipelotrichaceae bacterium]